MRLIDAEQIGLTDMEIIMCDGSYKKVLEMLIDKIDNAPTIDAVPVVRCKDCEYWDELYCCDLLTQDEMGFCKWGKRRENDG